MTIIIRSTIPAVHLMTCGAFLTAVKKRQPSIESTLMSCPFCFEQKGWTLNLLVSLAESAVTILKKIDEKTAKN